jgi:hypothetical protein
MYLKPKRGMVLVPNGIGFSVLKGSAAKLELKSVIGSKEGNEFRQLCDQLSGKETNCCVDCQKKFGSVVSKDVKFIIQNICRVHN